MQTQHLETLDQMVAYHEERMMAAMRAADSDRGVMLKYRARLGSLLITLGQRLRDDGACDLLPAPPPASRMTATLRTPPQGTCA